MVDPLGAEEGGGNGAPSGSQQPEHKDDPVENKSGPGTDYYGNPAPTIGPAPEGPSVGAAAQPGFALENPNTPGIEGSIVFEPHMGLSGLYHWCGSDYVYHNGEPTHRDDYEKLVDQLVANHYNPDFDPSGIGFNPRARPSNNFVNLYRRLGRQRYGNGEVDPGYPGTGRPSPFVSPALEDISDEFTSFAVLPLISLGKASVAKVLTGLGSRSAVVVEEALATETMAGAGDEMVTVYRGVSGRHPQFQNAMQGRAEP
jgi:hypothetical protein